MRWASSACCSSRPGNRRTSPVGRSRRPSTASRWSSSRSRATRVSRPAGSSWIDPGPRTRSTRWQGWPRATADLWLILSAEAFAGLPTWREPRRVLSLARLGVAPRDGYPDAVPDALEAEVPGVAARTVVLDGPRLRLSSSTLRTRAAAGRSLRYLVPDAVAAYIGDHALYRAERKDERT